MPEFRGGGQEGSGTRSSLLWECRRAIIAKRPRFLLLENVSNLVSEKFIATFRKWEQELASYGYDNRYKVLNSKDYGVPQNRERVFLVSFLDYQIFNFPQPIPLEKRLKDVLEDKVDERYYLSDKALAGLLEHNEKCERRGTGFLFSPKDISVNGGGYANCIATKPGYETGTYIICEDYPSGETEQLAEQHHRGSGRDLADNMQRREGRNAEDT